MEDLEKVLNLMSRMRMFPETENRLHKKIMVEDIANDLLEEGVFKSYDAKQIYKILLKHYNIGNEENFIKNGNDIGIYIGGSYNKDGMLNNSEIIVVGLVIPNNFKDIDKIKKFFELCGWKLAQENVYDKDDTYTVYVFHKNKQVNEVELPNILYHLTPITKLKKILSNGLVPRTSNVLSNRSERIYLLTEKRTFSFYQYFANQLWKSNLEQSLNLSGLNKKEIGEKLNQPRDIKYCLLEIDSTKCNNLKIFGDPDMDGAVWTYDNIPSKAIKVLTKNI